jgi:hypothetical protein
MEQLFRLPTTRILAWSICWLALLPEPIGNTSCKPTARTYPHDAQLEYFRTSGFVLAGDTQVIARQLRQECQSFRVAELAIRLETNAHFFGKQLVSV